ncbi:hypothetical protein LTSEWAN_0640, partial [Salmonella enterica subsp. enterica serovar Wandsworth str. A4-580]
VTPAAIETTRESLFRLEEISLSTFTIMPGFTAPRRNYGM